MRATTIEFERRRLWDAVQAIPPGAADAVAAVFMRLAAELRHVAQEHRERDERIRRARRDIDTLQEIPGMITRRMQDGMTLEEAKRAVHELLGGPRETIEYYWNRYEKIRPRLERSRRAVKMRAAGYSNAEIARALSCSPRTVARYLSHPL